MVTWIIEPAISLSLFYLAYILFLKRIAFFHANRLYLLTAIIFSLVLPHISLAPPVTITNYSYFISEVTITGQPEGDLLKTSGSPLKFSRVLVIIYLGGALVSGLRLIFRLLQLTFLAAGKKTRKYEHARIVRLDSDHAPFSFLNYIFINETLYREEEKKKIIEHELAHIRQFHTFDLILLELLTIIQWFNPVAWLFRKSMHEIHEYLADEEVIKKGTSIPFYQSLLLNLQMGNEFFPTVSNFNKSLTLNRIRMMTAIRPTARKKIRFFILLPSLIFLVFMCTKVDDELPEPGDKIAGVAVPGNSLSSTNRVNNEEYELSAGPVPDASEGLAAPSSYSTATDDSSNQAATGIPDNPAQSGSTTPENEVSEIFFIVEEMPDFQSGGQDAFRRYIAENLRYPQTAAQNGIQGRVFVQFVVKSDGSVADARIVRGVDSALDREAIRVVMSSPSWNPGRQRGQAVDVAFTFPINFVLREG